MNEPLFQMDNLSFCYDDDNPILENVTLTIARGEFIGIFGPNGGGKTTFLKLLMGFLQPTAGTLRANIASTQISYVPQIAGFDKKFPIRVLDLVLMGCLSESTWWGGLPPSAKHKAEQALYKVDLLDKQYQPFGTLSGGQAQRALIARALVSEPTLLLLDEPTASIDPEAENEIYKLLNALKGSMTILMVTHDLKAIMHKVGRLICIHRQASSLMPAEVCEHFALGLYHTPLIRPKT